MTRTASGVSTLAPVTMVREASPTLEVALLTGGGDRPYAFGLSMALTAKNVSLDFIGSDDLDIPELRTRSGLRFLNLRGSQSSNAGLLAKVWRIASYYGRLIAYAAVARPKIFHILWNNRFQTFDRTLLMLYYRLRGKKVVLTAHNINAGRRDASDSAWNRLTLRAQYHLAEHVFVHTDKMKTQLVQEFGVSPQHVTVIPLGINNSVPNTDLTSTAARERLGIAPSDKVLLAFGNIGPYKGLEYLIAAFQRLADHDASYRLLIVGRPKMGAEHYLRDIQETIARHPSAGRVSQTIEFVPDEDTEIYFKAADVAALPYTEVFQSGVLILSYSFGLPVIASDVGSLREDVIEGRTGFMCTPRDAADLERAIATYFASDLYRDLSTRRSDIQACAHARYSWDAVSDTTIGVYRGLLSGLRLMR